MLTHRLTLGSSKWVLGLTKYFGQHFDNKGLRNISVDLET